jgi:hypothetical protein
VAFCTVRFLSRNRISSQWTRHYCFWQPLFLVFPLYFARYCIRTQTYRNPTYFLFRKVSTQTLATLDPFLFAFVFRLVGILKLAAILFHLTNLVPRACDPWEGNEGSGIIHVRNEYDCCCRYTMECCNFAKIYF